MRVPYVSQGQFQVLFHNSKNPVSNAPCFAWLGGVLRTVVSFHRHLCIMYDETGTTVDSMPGIIVDILSQGQ